MNAEFNTDIRPALQPGDQLGYYEVRAPLAAGGLSLVWKAHDSLLNRDIAIKQVANTDQADEAVRQRFRQEADLHKKASAAHNNLVQVLDYVEEERGLFIVMEYVDGSSLDRMLTKLDGPMEPQQALGILHQLAIALAAIHQAGVIHRDLKPSNILLPRAGGVKVCDFGLATLFEDQDVATMGTARYMAPEQFTEDKVDGRCDLYALGMIAYEMLLGRPAFEDQFKTVLRDQRNQPLRWMKWHTNQRLIAQPIHKLNERVPGELSEIIERLMDKQVDRRIDSAATLLGVLKRHFSPAGRAAAAQASRAAQDAEQARLSAPLDPTAALPSSKRVPMWLIAAAVLLITTAVGLVVFFQMDKQNALERFTAKSQGIFDRGMALHKQEKYAEARVAFEQVLERESNSTLGRWSGQIILDCDARMSYAAGNEAMEARDFVAAHAAYESAYGSMSDLIDGLGPNDDAQKFHDRLNTYEDRITFSSIAKSIDALIQSGQTDTARNQIIDQQDKVTVLTDNKKEVLGYLSEKINRQLQREKIETVRREAERLVADGDLDAARDRLDEAREKMGTSEFDSMLREIEDEIDFTASMRGGERAEDAGNLASAIRSYERALDIRPTVELETKLDLLYSRKAYEDGLAKQNNGDFDGAAELYNRALGYNKDNLDAKRALDNLGRHITRAEILHEGNRAYAAGDYQLAANHFTRALDIEADAETRDLLNKAYTKLHAEKAEAALRRWDLSAAEEAVGQALRYSPNDVYSLRLKQQIAVSVRYRAAVDEGDGLYGKGAFADAGAAYRRARQIIADSSIDSEPIDKKIRDAEYESWMVKARAAADLRRWREAKANVEAALGVRDTTEARTLESQANEALKE